MARWIFTSPATGETWQVPINPNKMTRLTPKKNLTTKTTAAVNGRILVIQGATQPQAFSFGGDLLSKEHMAQLSHWVYEVPQRVQITDHFGRLITCYLEELDAVPALRSQYPYRHEYTVNGIVVAVTEPTLPDIDSGF